MTRQGKVTKNGIDGTANVFPYVDGQIKLAQNGKTKEDQSNRKNNRRPSDKLVN
jgi:hypothetical protein